MRRKRGHENAIGTDLGLITRLFGGTDKRAALHPLYAAVVAEARDPEWYRAGGVPDTLDGRFDMVAAILSLVLLRLEREPEAGAGPSALLTELFVVDMDGQLREQGVGDVGVGKQVGRMMSALGGRLSAYRVASSPGGDLHDALSRNLYRGAPPAGEEVETVAARLQALKAALESRPLDALLAGRVAA